MNEQFVVWQALMAAMLDVLYNDEPMQGWLLRPGETWAANASAAWERLASAPIQAVLSSEGAAGIDDTAPIIIGVGLAVTADAQQPPLYMGQSASRVYTAAVSVNVRGDLSAPYEVLLHTIGTVAQYLGGHVGELSHREDPDDSSSPLRAIVADIADEGDDGQDIDDNGDYVATRSFTVTLV